MFFLSGYGPQGQSVIAEVVITFGATCDTTHTFGNKHSSLC